MTPPPELTVVAPVYNEARILPELARRCLEAARRADAGAEVLLIDDGSTDGTRALAPTLPDGVALVSLPRNQGQLRATLAGLAQARGRVVVVLDGDLQDPPELIPTLVAAWRARPTDVVFAAKARRDDPLWFRIGRAVYGGAQRLPGVREVPRGVGAYCAMPHALARRASRIALAEGNLAAILVALGARWRTLPYDKAARYDGSSRVGALGLAREALASLALTGALAVLTLWLSACMMALVALTGASRRTAATAALAAGLAQAAAIVATLRARRRLHPAQERT